MFAQILGETICGIDGVQILVEVDVSNGLPSFDLVGLPAMAVRESKERVKAALRNSNYPFPMTRITVNLAPADLRKEGSGLDLPIAVGLMTCGRILEPEKLENKVFIGELSLDGRIRNVSGVLSMIMDAKKCGAQEVYIPQANAAEGKLIHGIDVYTVATLKELVEHLNKLGGENGIGLLDIVENRLVGMKSRGVYETPGGAILYKAINVLETITLDKESAHFKAQLAQKYADIVYNGQWFTPLREALDAFANSLEKTVTGDVKLKLYKGNMINAGVTSPFTLYDEQTASFGVDKDYDQSDATGFINLFGLSIKERAKLSKSWPKIEG